MSVAEAPLRERPRAEFIALMAVLAATVAFSIDAMLPALPQIADELTQAAPNRAQLILTSFVLGMGLGTLLAGPLSDALGRRPVILWGFALYVAGALMAWSAPTLELVLAGRIVQGIGAAGPRVVSTAIIRDRYAGRAMARLMSFVMTVFALVPAIGPALGAGIIALTGWRGIFLAFTAFALISAGWFHARQPETLSPERRRPLRAADLLAAIREVFSHRDVRIAILVLTLLFGGFFSVLSTVQPVFDVTFGMAGSFHLWFAAIAVLSMGGSLLNAAIVERFGMRRIVTAVLTGQAVASGLVGLAVWAGLLTGTPLLAVYFVWTLSVFMMAGLTMGNLSAIAMEPLGHIAGMAASVTGSVATVGAVPIAAAIGLAFDGTPAPVAFGLCLTMVLGAALMRRLPHSAA